MSESLSETRTLSHAGTLPSTEHEVLLLRLRTPRQGVDFRDGEAVLERCREWATLGTSTDPMFPGAYGGADAHPLELVFFKTNRGLQEEALAVHTRAALANAPWAVPAALLCGA